MLTRDDQQPALSPADEGLVHQIPEPIGAVASTSPYWRESYFFVAHRPDTLGDVLVLTMASLPAHRVLDSYQIGYVDGQGYFARHSRPYGADPHGTEVGPVSVQIQEPFHRARLRVDGDHPGAKLGFDLTWTARTAPYLTRRGTMTVDGRLVWDQRQMFQSGWLDGEYMVDGTVHRVRRWWGQRDHSWGVRDHARCPLWIWLAIQLPDGMAGVWCWEYADGRRCYTDGCWAPAEGGAPVPVITFAHDLHWQGAGGRTVRYGQAGPGVIGLAGRVVLGLADGTRITVDGEGTWTARYGRRGGGLHQMLVRTDDGREGTAIYEVTGSAHHRYFPEPRG